MQIAMDPYLHHGGVFAQPLCSQRLLSFKTDPGNSSSGVVTGSMGCSTGLNSSIGSVHSNNSMASPSSSSSVLVETGHGLKYNTPMSVDWSYEELVLLKKGLEKYANEPGIMKYVKIAANLPEKTVRDVAMRCQWMMKKDKAKRRKHGESTGKRTKEKKSDSNGLMIAHSMQSEYKPSPSYMSQDISNVNQYISQGHEFNNVIIHSLEENARLLDQIATNIVSCQSQNNIELLNRTRNNINAVLNSMTQMPGIMSKMPPLPVSMNEWLASYLVTTLPGSTIGHSLSSIGRLNDERQGW